MREKERLDFRHERRRRLLAPFHLARTLDDLRIVAVSMPRASFMRFPNR